MRVIKENKERYAPQEVNHPPHYNQGGIECIEAMESAFGSNAVIVFCKLNAFKYIWRSGDKVGNSEAQDLSKAAWYVDKARELIEKNANH